jgi:hypothetical protein
MHVVDASTRPAGICPMSSVRSAVLAISFSMNPARRAGNDVVLRKREEMVSSPAPL